MFRNAANSACGINVFDTEESVKTCAKNKTYKLYMMGMSALIGFFIILIIVLIIFTEPVTSTKTIVATSGEIEPLSVRMSSGSYNSPRRSSYNSPRRSSYNSSHKSSANTKSDKISSLGWKVLFVGTLLCGALGYYLADESSLIHLFKEDDALIKEKQLLTGDREKAIISLRQERELTKRIRQEMRPRSNRYNSNSGFSLNLDL